MDKVLRFADSVTDAITDALRALVRGAVLLAGRAAPALLVLALVALGLGALYLVSLAWHAGF